MKKIIALCFAITVAGFVYGQNDYKQAIGIKFPGGTSITYKNFITETKSIEALMTFWEKGFKLSALYEFNFPIQDVQGLNWYVGPGVHLGGWKNKFKDEQKSSADFGIDGIIGLDYKFADIPINISLDWQPSITLLGNSDFVPTMGGLAIRYTF